MPLPDNFALLALSPTIRDNDGFLFLQTGQAGYIDIMVQSATGLPVNILKVGSGIPVSQYIYVNQNGNDSIVKKENNSKIIYYLENKVVAQYLQCDDLWCQIRINNKKGWVLKEDIYGI